MDPLTRRFRVTVLYLLLHIVGCITPDKDPWWSNLERLLKLTMTLIDDLQREAP